MSRELFEHYATKEGLNVVRAETVDWELPSLDCITVLEHATAAERSRERSQAVTGSAHTG
jgi:hypothetical protein